MLRKNAPVVSTASFYPPNAILCGALYPSTINSEFCLYSVDCESDLLLVKLSESRSAVESRFMGQTSFSVDSTDKCEILSRHKIARLSYQRGDGR